MKRIKKLHIVIVSGILLILALGFHWLDLEIFKVVALIIATVVAGYSTAKAAVQTTLLRMFSIELLVTIAVIGALIIGEYVESAAVTFLFLFGAYLEARTIEKTRTSLQTLMDMAPDEATVLKNGERVITAIEDIVAGDLILIQSGEKVAVDGRVVAGQALVNEATITGESVPARKLINDQVFSGTLIDNGYIE